MVGNVEFIVVNRHSFVRKVPHGYHPRPHGTKNDPLSSAARDALTSPATKSAHLLPLTRYPRPYPRFPKKPQAFYLRFCFRTFRYGQGWAVKRSRWAGFVPAPSHLRAKAPPRRREMPPWRRGVGWGLRFGLLPAARGLLAPGAVIVPSAYGYPRPGLRRRPWR